MAATVPGGGAAAAAPAQQQPPGRQTGRKAMLVPITTIAAASTEQQQRQTLLVDVASATAPAGVSSPSPAPTDSGLGTPCISSASTDSSASSSGRRRRANQPLRGSSSSEEDSAEDTSSCASSTAYQRVPGFRDHAHAHPVRGRPAKEKRPMLQHQPLPAVVAAASVPMRSRHLPKSMWQEPDVATYSPATTVLPRLPLHRSVDDVSELGASPFKVAAGAGGSRAAALKPPVRTVLNLDPSAEALQRRMFEVALKAAPEQQKKRPIMERLQPIGHRPPVSSKSSFLSNNDPCLSDCNKFPYLARAGGLAAAHSESIEGLQLHQPHQHQNQQRENPSQLLAEFAKHL